MARYRNYGWGLGLAVGMVVGLVLGGLWPDTPLHASATDRVEDFAIATGFVDDGVEAVFYLDYLTGNLNGAVPSRKSKAFQSFFTTNVHADLQSALAKSGTPAPQKPNYLLVTGTANMVTQGRSYFGKTIIYVAETNTGMVLAYAVPWSREFYSADKLYQAALIPWAAQKFSASLMRPE